MHRHVPPRSRTIWDEARKPNARLTSLLNAILYELQPVRFSTLNTSGLQQFARSGASSVLILTTKVLPVVLGRLYRFIRDRSARDWMVVGGVFLYWRTVVFLHRTLEAGPIFLIISALFVIFTVGLSDGNGADDGQMSAYAVFNRGFQTMLGSVDVENLIAQHAGGGGGAVMMRGGNGGFANGDWNDDEDRIVMEGEGEAAIRPEEVDEQVDPPVNRARRSNKKERRKRNKEVKREMQRQREAAIAMGFRTGGENRDDVDETMAMNRLIEEQVAAEEVNR